jgi:hypothetical protein
MIVSSKGEKYLCEHCKKEYTYPEVYKRWTCPDCSESISIRIEIGDFVHSCYRITPGKLKIGELVTLENKFIHAILNIEKIDSEYRIALQSYGVVTADETRFFSMINGAWTDKES